MLTPIREFLAGAAGTFQFAHFPRSGCWREGANAVFQAFRSASSAEKAFVLGSHTSPKRWSAHVLIDSSKLKGYIGRPGRSTAIPARPTEIVRSVAEAYFRAAHAYARRADGLVKLVMEDARNTGAEALNETKPARSCRASNGRTL